MAEYVPREQMLERLATMTRTFYDSVPFNRALGTVMGPLEDGVAHMTMPWSPQLVGDPVSGVLHGGAITALLDACSGASVFMKLRWPRPIATLDLRIDYLRPATAQKDVEARAECYRITRHVAFVRAVAHQGDIDDPVASCAGSFFIKRRRERPDEQAENEETAEKAEKTGQPEPSFEPAP